MRVALTNMRVHNNSTQKFGVAIMLSRTIGSGFKSSWTSSSPALPTFDLNYSLESVSHQALAEMTDPRPYHILRYVFSSTLEEDKAQASGLIKLLTHS
jgi:hypothetical protein